MGQHVVLSDSQQKEYWQVRDHLPIKRTYIGQCKSCGRRIPHGYLATVTKWKVEKRNGVTRMVADEVYCRSVECSSHVTPQPTHRRRRIVKQQVETPVD